jgi:hypothetical protein
LLGSFGPKEHDALRLTNIPNDGCLNRVLEQMGVSYAPRPLPGSEASQAAIMKWKVVVSKKLVVKRVRLVPAEPRVPRRRRLRLNRGRLRE